MTRNAWIAAVLVAVTAGVPAGAAAFSIATSNDKTSGSVVRWANPYVQYYLDTADAPGVNDGSTAATIKESFQDWEDVDCSALAFGYMGPTTNKNVLPISQTSNDRNEFVWSPCSKWGFGSYVLGVTLPYPDWYGKIQEADIAMNGCIQWNTQGEVGGWGNETMDVKSVAIHEIGHLFGLQHVLSGASTQDPPTMNPAVDYQGRTATLAADDKLGACFLYPDPDYYPSGYYTCKDNTVCPRIVGHSGENEVYVGSLTCSGGYCNGVGGGIAPGSVAFGGTCSLATDCVSGDKCQQLDSGIKMCTRTCSMDADNCPTGFSCAILKSGAGAFCVPGSKKKVIGEACLTSYECATSFCFPTPDGSGTFCRTACNKNDPSTCGVGEACWTSGFSTAGGCFPKDQVPVPKKPLDTFCEGDNECSSGLCWTPEPDPYRCRKVCDPASPVCYTGYYCRTMPDGRSACVPGDNSDGEPCASDLECASKHCEALPTAPGVLSCRTRCDLATWACEWGTSCVAYGADYGLCMPSLDKQGTGVACGSGDECLTTICRVFDSGSICTQNCVNGWCPDGMHCAESDLGPLCVPGAPLVTEDLGPVQEDLGRPGEETTEEDVPSNVEADLGPGGEDVIVAPAPGGGCAAGGAADPVSMLSLLLALGGVWGVRRRRRFQGSHGGGI